MIFTKPAHRGISPPPDGIDFSHLWRMNDAFGTTSPDTGSVGGAPITIGGSPILDPNGIDFQSIADRFDIATANLDVDIADITAPYSLFVSLTLRSEDGLGETSLLFDAGDQGGPIYVYVRSTTIMRIITAATCVGPVWSEPGIPPMPHNIDLCLVRRSPTSGNLYIVDGDTNTIYSTSADGAGGITDCADDGELVIGNRRAGNRGADAFFKWAGFVSRELTVQEIEQISAGGRP